MLSIKQQKLLGLYLMSVKKFSLVIGILYLTLGISGAISASPGTAELSAQITDSAVVAQGVHSLFGLFPINTFESFVYIVIGLGGLVGFVGTEPFARLYADTLAVWLGLIGVLGFIPVANQLFGLMPIYGNDVWLHLSTAIAAAYFGFFLDRGRPDRDPSVPDSLDPDPLEQAPIGSE